MNVEEGLRTPSKGTRAASTASPSANLRSGSKKPTKNAKITNFFTKVNSPLTRNSSNSNNEHSENDNQQNDDLSKDASSSSMKVPENCATDAKTKKNTPSKEYVFIIPSSDDDTNISTKAAGRRRKPPSVHSGNSRSSDGLILTSTSNNELGLGPRKRSINLQNIDKQGANSNHESPSTPTRSSGRDSRSRDSLPETKRLKLESVTIQAFNQNSGQKINRIQPTLIRSRTKMIDFQSVPSDLNLPRAQALELIEQLFLVKMPEDFFLFWEFAKTINHRKPCSAFSHAYLEWNLVGPYDVLSGLITDFHGFSKDNLLRHCRFYYDPPEFQTVIIKKDSNLTHYGYYRDEPDQDKAIVLVNKASSGGKLQEVGDNLFTLLKSELETLIGSLSKSSQEIPTLTFSSSSSNTPRSKPSGSNTIKQSQLEKAKARQELTIIRDKLIDFCSSHENLSCESWSMTNARRERRCVNTFNTVGIVTSKDGQDDLCDLGITESKLKTMLTRISDFKDDKTKCGSYEELNSLISNANMTGDNCNSALGLGLGLDLFFQGDSFYHKHIESLLTQAYLSLKREKFVDILKAHLEQRTKGDKVSLLD